MSALIGVFATATFAGTSEGSRTFLKADITFSMLSSSRGCTSLPSKMARAGSLRIGSAVTAVSISSLINNPSSPNMVNLLMALAGFLIPPKASASPTSFCVGSSPGPLKVGKGQGAGIASNSAFLALGIFASAMFIANSLQKISW